MLKILHRYLHCKIFFFATELPVDPILLQPYRLPQSYQQFYLENNWGDPDLLLDSVKMCELSKIQEVSVHSVKEMLPKVDKIIPDTEDFEDGSYALNASAAVYEALEFLVDKDKQHVLNIGTYLTDTIDSKIQEEDEFTQQQIDDHPMMIEARKYLLEG